MNYKGFTLIELLIACSIFCVLLMFSSSLWNFLKQKNEQELLIDDIKNAVHFSRIQALTRGKALVLSPADSSLNWSKGLVLNQINKSTHQEDLLYQWTWTYPHLNVTWHGATGAHQITFSGNTMSAMSNGTFIITNSQTGNRRVLVLNRLGRIKESRIVNKS